MNSINAQTEQHGVIAGDPGNGGLKLTTVDGRNLSVWYDASVAVGSDFGLGMNTATSSDPEGVTGVASAALAAIENKDLKSCTTVLNDPKITVASTKGLVAGMKVSGAGIPDDATILSINSDTSITLSEKATAASTTTELNFSGGVKASTVYGTVNLNSDKEFSLNPGVNSYPRNITTSTGNTFTSPDQTTLTKLDSEAEVSFNFNGKISSFKVGKSPADYSKNFADALNQLAGNGGKIAYIASDTIAKSAIGSANEKTLTMNADDIKGLVPGMLIVKDGVIPSGTLIESISGTTITISNKLTTALTTFDVGAKPGAGEVYIAHAASSSITFTSPDPNKVTNPDTVKSLENSTTATSYLPKSSTPSSSLGLAFSSTTQEIAEDPDYSNLRDLGFVIGAVSAKNIGRLNFQVGPAANQLISIDLADFGKNGDITGPITSDKAPTNLLTVQSANDVIMNVNKSLDRIAATRATMGAVMNRLTHVIDNLTNVVMNSESSRSQIEDADYAKASTELARTQIMQQAATAVLAQANTSQQTVLKLLQG
jgi:flagellin